MLVKLLPVEDIMKAQHFLPLETKDALQMNPEGQEIWQTDDEQALSLGLSVRVTKA